MRILDRTGKVDKVTINNCCLGFITLHALFEEKKKNTSRLEKVEAILKFRSFAEKKFHEFIKLLWKRAGGSGLDG